MIKPIKPGVEGLPVHKPELELKELSPEVIKKFEDNLKELGKTNYWKVNFIDRARLWLSKVFVGIKDVYSTAKQALGAMGTIKFILILMAGILALAIIFKVV